MNVYMYQAALWCQDCGEALREALVEEGKAPQDPEDESSYDSDDFPKGPFADGGGEADVPQHCDANEECINAITLFDGRKIGAFLENDLTSDGEDYVKEAVADAEVEKREGSVALEVWKDFYDQIDYSKIIDEKEVKDLVREQFKIMGEKAEDRKDWTNHFFTIKELQTLADHLRDLGFDDLADEVDSWPDGYSQTKYMQHVADWLNKLDDDGPLRKRNPAGSKPPKVKVGDLVKLRFQSGNFGIYRVTKTNVDTLWSAAKLWDHIASTSLMRTGKRKWFLTDRGTFRPAPKKYADEFEALSISGTLS